MTKINEIDYECLIKNRHYVFGLEEITCVASNLAATDTQKTLCLFLNGAEK